MIRNLIWDVDGTLFDTYPAINGAFRSALHDLGADASLESISLLTLVSLDHCASVLAETFDLPVETVERGFRDRYAERALSDSPPFPGVVDVCRYIGSIGGTNVIVTHRRRSSTEALLAANGMEHLFAGLLSAAEGYPRKPDPAMFEAAIDAFELDRAATMAIGDRALDVEAARAAGVRSCLFSPDGDGEADLLVNAFSQLLGALQRSA